MSGVGELPRQTAGLRPRHRATAPATAASSRARAVRRSARAGSQACRGRSNSAASSRAAAGAASAPAPGSRTTASATRTRPDRAGAGQSAATGGCGVQEDRHIAHRPVEDSRQRRHFEGGRRIRRTGRHSRIHGASTIMNCSRRSSQTGQRQCAGSSRNNVPARSARRHRLQPRYVPADLAFQAAHRHRADARRRRMGTLEARGGPGSGSCVQPRFRPGARGCRRDPRARLAAISKRGQLDGVEDQRVHRVDTATRRDSAARRPRGRRLP